MNIDKFINLVTDMRRAQKDYFACRDESFLRLAKSLEQQVDKAIANYKQDTPSATQFTLFDVVTSC